VRNKANSRRASQAASASQRKGYDGLDAQRAAAKQSQSSGRGGSEPPLEVNCAKRSQFACTDKGGGVAAGANRAKQSQFAGMVQNRVTLSESNGECSDL